MKEKIESGFSAINSPTKLHDYLISSERIKNMNVLHHYTNINAVFGIINSGFWVLKNPLKMNDELENSHWKPNELKKMFFISFMGEQKESIGMWSMYAQPWSDGVKVSIKKEALKKWLQSIKKIYKADPENYSVDEHEYVEVAKKNSPQMTAVAYTTCDDPNSNHEQLFWSNRKNDNFRQIYENQELMGFIKNDAWLYEKEIRLRVDLDQEYPAIALKITDEILNAMTITAGPRFNGIIEERFRGIISRHIKTERSLFYGKLRNIPCDKCTQKKEDKAV